MVIDAIGVFEFAQKANFFEDVLPLLQGLFATVGHLFDGHDLVGDIVTGIVDSSKTTVTDFAEVVKEFFRVLALKEQGRIGVLETARPAK